MPHEVTGILQGGNVVLTCGACGASAAVEPQGHWVDSFNDFIAGHIHHQAGFVPRT